MKDERPTPLVEDIDAIRRKLAAWLGARKGTDVRLSELHIPEATGMSNVTLLFDMHWRESGISHSEACVGRLQPDIAKPVFPTYDLGLQYRVMQILDQQTDIPAPTLRGLETDTSVLGVPFYVMKKTEGRIPTDMPPYNMDGWMMHDTSLAQRETLWNAAIDTMARFHQLDYLALGLDFVATPGSSATPLQDQLAYWRHYLDWGMEDHGHTICSAALDWLDSNQPAQQITRLCWGDSRLANMIFSQDCSTVAAVLDWEMAVLGNPVQDLAWFCYLDSTFAEGLGMPRLEGLPGYEETVERWHRATNYPVDDYDYYLIFAAMRYGLILSRIMVAQGQAAEIETNFASALLAKHLDKL